MLPYSLDRRLREKWWRRNDKVIAISTSVVDSDGELIFDCSGISPPIHEMNSVGDDNENPKLISEKDALEYVKFFCHTVHGEEGPFSLLDSRRAIEGHVPKKNLDVARDQYFEPICEYSSNTGWAVKCVIRYATGLFHVNLQIDAGGMVAMLDDNPVVVWDDGEGQKFHSDGNLYFYF